LCAICFRTVRPVSRTLQLEGITSLQIAIKKAKTIKLIQESNFEQRKRMLMTMNVEDKGENKNNNNFNSNFNWKARDCKKDFGNNTKEKEGKFNKNRFRESKNNERKRSGKKFRECEKRGHFRLECLGKQENEE